MSEFYIQAIKIPAYANGKYKGETHQEEGDGWQKVFPEIDIEDINQLFKHLDLSEAHGPWEDSDTNAIHIVVNPLENDEDKFEDYELVRVELQCLRKKEIRQ